MPDLNTLRYFKESGCRIWASCLTDRSCSHFGDVSIDSLIQHLGWDFIIVEGRDRLRGLLVCSECGRRWPQIGRASPETAGKVGGAHGNSPGVTVSEVSYEEALRRAVEFRKEHPHQPAGGKRWRRWQ